MASPLYSPLDQTHRQIRLLHLAPAVKDEDEIVCHLSLASLDANIKYEALSYVWGDVKDTLPIKVYCVPSKKNSSSAFRRLRFKIRARVPWVKNNVVPVTKNLHSALKHLRLHDQARVLWIDALCINQSDLGERSHQVPYMSSVFGGASSVIVWLGEAWEGSDLAMEVIQRLGQDENLHLDRSLSPSLVVKGVGLESEDLRYRLVQFFDLPWWKRVWTIQEFVLARRVVIQCGQRLLPGKLLFKFRKNLLRHVRTCCIKVKLIDKLEKSNVSMTEAIEMVFSLEIAQTRRKSLEFLYILAQFRNRQATDDRDTIYGMLSLASDFIFQPDYTLSCPKVFEDFTIAIINQTGRLDILSHLFGERKQKLPSFVPDLTGSIYSLPSYLDRLNKLKFNRASADSLVVFNLIASGKVVTRGVILDKIKVTTSLNLDEMQQLAEIGHEDGSPYKFTGEPLKTAFGRMMCASLEFNETSRSLRRVVKPFDLSNFQKWQAWTLAAPEAKESLYDSDVSNFHHANNIACIGRVTVKSEHGYIGFAPNLCQKGDIIAVLAGGRVPYVLRPEPDKTHEGHPCYTILGDSYIHGVMDGEAFELPDGTEPVLEEIILV